MNPESRETVYAGFNFVLNSRLTIDKKTNLRFQQELVNEMIDVQRVEFTSERITAIRLEPRILEINVLALPNSPVSQLLITTQGIGCTLQMFGQEAEAVIRAFAQTWGGSMQVVNSDSTIREIFASTAEHAFQELWETRLKQPSEALAAFPYPAIGGGLRLAFRNPSPENSKPTEIETRIESFFGDSSKMFIETTYRWLVASEFQDIFKVNAKLNEIETFISSSLTPFVMGDQR